MSTPGKTPSIPRITALLVAAILALATGYWVADHLFVRPAPLSDLHATVFSNPRDIQPFTLADHTGKVFDNRSLLGHWSFVFFGYTHCPDVCPTTLSVLSSVARKVGSHADDVQFVFITIDPERDSPEKLGQFLSRFNGGIIGVTGTSEAIRTLAHQVGITFARVEDNTGAGNYTMDHGASVLLFDPAGRFHAVFTPPLDATDMASDFGMISRAYGNR
jgi:protein SCO1/2